MHAHFYSVYVGYSSQAVLLTSTQGSFMFGGSILELALEVEKRGPCLVYLANRDEVQRTQARNNNGDKNGIFSEPSL